MPPKAPPLHKTTPLPSHIPASHAPPKAIPPPWPPKSHAPSHASPKPRPCKPHPSMKLHPLHPLQLLYPPAPFHPPLLFDPPPLLAPPPVTPPPLAPPPRLPIPAALGAGGGSRALCHRHRRHRLWEVREAPPLPGPEEEERLRHRPDLRLPPLPHPAEGREGWARTESPAPS